MTARHLDVIVRTARTLDLALSELDRTHLRALAERLEIESRRSAPELETMIRRRLMGLPGRRRV